MLRKWIMLGIMALTVPLSVSADYRMDAAYYNSGADTVEQTATPEPTATEVYVPEGAILLSDIPAGMVMLEGGVEWPLVDGWQIYADEIYLQKSAILIYGKSIIINDGFAIISVNEQEELSQEFYRDNLVGMLAPLYTGRDDYDAARDIVTETLEDGRVIELLDTSDATDLVGNIYLVPLDNRYWVSIQLSLGSQTDTQARLDEMLTMARAMVRVIPDDVVTINDLELTVEPMACNGTVSRSLISEKTPYALIQCPANCAAEGSRPIWGTDIYTLDSNACAAAVHAGAITDADGGTVLLTWLPGQTSYAASERNGITSTEYGRWGESFQAEPFTVSEPQLVVTVPAIVQDTVTIAGSELLIQTMQCNSHADSSRVSETTPQAVVRCPANCIATGGNRVWGTDIYTLDSNACVAAIHAGVITDAEGGLVLLNWLPGQDAYAGSTRNGVTSSEYGRWGASFSMETVTQ